MADIRKELESFNQFVADRLAEDEQDGLGLESYVRLWRANRERTEVLADIQQAVAELDAGRGYSLDEAAAIVRERLQSSECRRTA